MADLVILIFLWFVFCAGVSLISVMTRWLWREFKQTPCVHCGRDQYSKGKP